MTWKLPSSPKASHLLHVHKDQLKYFRKQLAKAHPELWAEFEKQCVALQKHDEYRSHMEYLKREYSSAEVEVIPDNLNDIWRAFSRQTFIMSEDARQVSVLADLYRFRDMSKDLEVLRFRAKEALDAADTLRHHRSNLDEEDEYMDQIDIHVDGGAEEWDRACARWRRLKVEVQLAELNLRLLTESCPERLFGIQEEIGSLVACSLDLLITEEPEIQKLLSSLEELCQKIEKAEALYDEWSYFADHEAASGFLEELEDAQKRATSIMLEIQVIELETLYDEYSYFVNHEAAVPLLEKAEKLQALIDKGEVPRGENCAEEVRNFLDERRRELC